MKINNADNRLKIQRLMAFVFLFLLHGCAEDCANKIADIHISSAANNSLKVQIDINTTDSVDTYIEYWLKENEQEKFTTQSSKHNKTHRLILTNLLPKKDYNFQVITGNGKCTSASKTYPFSTPENPAWIQEIFGLTCPKPASLPAEFKQGYTFIYKRETPGILFMLDDTAAVRWYHQVNGTGVKVAHFTQNKTILCLLGNEKYETSYGDEILELSLQGDTLTHLKKGMNDFKQTIHHEVLLNAQNNIVTLCVEEKIYDLSAKGGSKQDTIKGDGIIVFDKAGKQLWKWTVFDTVNPLEDKNILKEKKDWMHANSVTIDKDGNYLLSFYNNGQIWKIDAHTGKLLWKFGKGGDFNMPVESYFDQAHAVHFNSKNELMFFDNGTSKKISRTLAFKLDESNKKAALTINNKLPPEFYNERMGSSYLINDTTLLQCCSKRNMIVLANMNGTFLWLLKTGISPYRAEFISKEQLEPYIINKAVRK